MSKQEKKVLVPALRFPEFRDAGEWEEEKFEKIYSFKPTNSLSRDKLNYQQGSVKNIHYGDIHTKFSTLFDIEKEAVPYINPTESLEKIKPESFCVEGDMIFADASEDMDDIGKCIEIVSLNNEKLVSGLHTLLARQINKKLIVGFGGYLFKSSRIREQIRKESQGAKVLGLSGGRLSSITVVYPADEKEQQKIADCLTSIDDLITAQTQKVEALKAHKKGLMQQLFPAEGETVPKLRFPEFRDAGEWDIEPLKKLANRRTERNRDGKLTRVLTNSAEHGVVDQREYFDKDIAIQGNLENYFIVKKDDFVYNPRISAFAPVGPISRNCVETGVMSPLYKVFYFKNSNTNFYAHYFKSSTWHMYMRQVGSTGARHDRMAISNEDFTAMPLPVPSPEEQQKIADCLTSIDDLITAQAQKLATLKAHKKGLMQQLFPAVDEVNG